MKNDKSQFVVRTSDFYLSLVIGHLPFNPLLAGKDFSSRNLRALGALRGFAVNPGLDFHREGAKHAKKTRRTLVWLRPCCSVFICGLVHTFGARIGEYSLSVRAPRMRSRCRFPKAVIERQPSLLRELLSRRDGALSAQGRIPF